ncbi:MAG: heavy metal translocating P-type ATPase [Lachnospiraceae bacterium]|nr:heavy metal translocating P-type ATPase [Lachnospiraceae bacterium]
MTKYAVTGMSCAACVASVERAVSSVKDVRSVSVSLLTNSMIVDGGSPDEVIKAVGNAGYGASLMDGSSKKEEEDYTSRLEQQEKLLEDTETPKLKRRLFVSLGFLIVLMYISMGHHMLNLPVPKIIGSHASNGFVQMLLASFVMLINRQFFINGFKGLVHRAPNMDSLVSVGSAAGYVYSAAELLILISPLKYAEMPDFYFESSAMILVLITVGKMLEARSKGRTTDALKSLMKLSPREAVLVENGEEITVPIERVKTGDIFAVRPGENVPVDGVIVEGEAAINEAALSGESMPVDKKKGDTVSAATTNMSGYIRCRATRIGEDTTLSQIIRMVSDASATKAPIAKTADRVAGVFVPVVMGIALLTFIVWILIGRPVGFSLARAISVLVISCPCALGLATPVAIMVGSGIGAKHGILFKTAEALEETGKVQIVSLDKTGTITEGTPVVTDVLTSEGTDERTLLRLAGALEQGSEHPLAKAVVSYVEKDAYADVSVSSFEALPGNGLKALLDGSEVFAGNEAFILRHASVPEALQKKAEALSLHGKTPMYFASEGRLLGIIFVADVIRKDSGEAIRKLQNMGIRVVMLTGDNEQTAKAIGEKAGVDRIISGVLPAGKAEVISRLKTLGKTVMIGDGINDAPALTTADIGTAVVSGTDVAIDAADVVLMNSNLTDAAAAVRLSRAVIRNIKENLFWAFFYNTLGIPLAAGVFIPVFGWQLNPMFGAAAMSLSSFFVVTNALRLNLKDIYDASKDRPMKNAVSKEQLKALTFENAARLSDACPVDEKTAVMTKELAVTGMMCEHCEKRVKKALEKLDGVVMAETSFEKGTALVSLSKDVDEALLRQAVEDAGYGYEGIKGGTS